MPSSVVIGFRAVVLIVGFASAAFLTGCATSELEHSGRTVMDEGPVEPGWETDWDPALEPYAAERNAEGPKAPRTVSPASTAVRAANPGKKRQSAKSKVDKTDRPEQKAASEAPTNAEPITPPAGMLPPEPSLTPKTAPGKVVLRWETSRENEVRGYYVLRADSATGPFDQINNNILPGSGSRKKRRAYEFVDTNVVAGRTYYYYLEIALGQGGRERFSQIMSSVAKARD